MGDEDFKAMAEDLNRDAEIADESIEVPEDEPDLNGSIGEADDEESDADDS